MDKVEFKRIEPKGNGAVKWQCPKGHISNYRIGTGLLKDPYKCPQCEGLSAFIGNELQRLNKEVMKNEGNANR